MLYSAERLQSTEDGRSILSKMLYQVKFLILVLLMK
jgi:hypothetical protein